MASHDQAERPPKKPRYEKSIPFVPIHSTIVASRSSAILNTGYPFQLLRLRHVTTDALFFPDTTARAADPDAIEIGKIVRTALSSSRGDEKMLRNAVYTELKRQGIQFPASSEPLQQEMMPRSLLSRLLRRLWNKESKTLEYKEQNLAHVLHELWRERVGDEDLGTVVPEEKLLHGLNVTTESRPSMTVLKGDFLYFGEFKNSDRYTNESAAKQCTLYLYALMYFLRVRLGRPVKAVFGFWVCGAGCVKKETKYTVGYVHLSAPERLGDSLVPQVFQSSHNVDSVAGIQKLVWFLKEGKSVELEEDIADIDEHRRTPALLSLPTSLWGSDLLISNGTAAMVFKGNGDEIRGLLDQVGVRSLDYDFALFLSSAHGLLSGKETMFFLKIRLKETTPRDSPAQTAADLLYKRRDFFQQLYPIKPFGNGDCGLMLMNDCGDALYQSEAFRKLGFPAFCECFANLWEDLIALSDLVLHGDALPHNIVYNESNQRLMLIDFDEGIRDGDAYERVVKQSEDFAYLRYPNYLRSWVNRLLYTQLQLAVSFVMLAPLVQQTMVAQDKAAVGGLREAATTADSFLEQTNDIDPAITGSDHDQSLYRLVELLGETLSRYRRC